LLGAEAAAVREAGAVPRKPRAASALPARWVAHHGARVARRVPAAAHKLAAQNAAEPTQAAVASGAERQPRALSCPGVTIPESFQTKWHDCGRGLRPEALPLIFHASRAGPDTAGWVREIGPPRTNLGDYSNVLAASGAGGDSNCKQPQRGKSDAENLGL